MRTGITTFPRTGIDRAGSRHWKKPVSILAVSAAIGVVLGGGTGLPVAPAAQANTPPTPTIAAIIPVGAGPADLKFNPAGTRAYVSSTGSSTLSVIDTATKSVVATIPTAPSPRSIAVNRAGTRVYVESEDANHAGTVTVIDATTNTSAGTFNVGPFPGTMAVSKDGTKLFIGHLFGMSVVDTATKTVTTDIDLPGVPRDALMNETGTRLYASMVNGNSGNIFVIDTTTNSLAATIPVTGAPGSMALDPSGASLYVGGGVWGGFAVLDTATNTVARTVQYSILGAMSDTLALDPNGKHLYTWTGAFDIRAGHTITSIQDVDPATGKSNLQGNLAELTSITGNAGSIAVSPDGSTLYARGSDYNTVTVLALPPAAPTSTPATPIGDKVRSLNGGLGAATTGEVYGLRDGGGYQCFQQGCVVWSPATGAHVSRGGIRSVYSSAGFENGKLGYPTSDEIGGFKNGGVYQSYQGGAIYWSPDTGAHLSVGGIRTLWGSTGFESGPLGYPTSEEIGGLKNGGVYQLYQGGAIYWSSTTGAHVSRGGIRGAWGSTGFENGKLGYPTSEEIGGLKNGGVYQLYQGGATYWSPATGAHMSTGAIRSMWAAIGFENGRLGYPTSDEYVTSPGNYAQNYQGGVIIWGSKGTGITYK